MIFNCLIHILQFIFCQLRREKDALLALFQNEYARRDYPVGKRKMEADDIFKEALADPSSLLQTWIDEARRLEADHAQSQTEAAQAAAQAGVPWGKGGSKTRGAAAAAPLPRAAAGSASTMFAAGVAPTPPGFFGLGGLAVAGSSTDRARVANSAPAGRFVVKFRGGGFVLLDTQNQDLVVELPQLADEG